MNLCDDCKKQLMESLAKVQLNYKNKSREDLERALAMSTLLLTVLVNETKAKIHVSLEKDHERP